MDTNPNSSSDSLIPSQPVIGAGIAEIAAASGSSAAAVATPSATCNTIGPHNIGSIRLAAGRSLAGSSTSGPSGASTSTSSSESRSPSSSTSSIVNLRNRASIRRGPVTPAKIQFLVLGSSNVGKTSLLRRLQNLNATTDASVTGGSTIGPDLHRLKCGQVEAIDIGGSDACYPIAQAYCELFDAFVVMFDITSAESFLYARFWMDYIDQRTQRQSSNSDSSSSSSSSQSTSDPESKSARPPPTILLIGNKKDLETADPKCRQVSKNLAKNLAFTFGAEYLEISARHDLSLNEAILDTLERKHEDNLKVDS